MKTHVLLVSQYFPKTHPRAGEGTHFVEKIYAGQKLYGLCDNCDHKDCPHCELALSPKIHTIRSNYDWWKKRIDEVNAGEAVLSIRYWAGKPYHKDANGVGQVEILRLTGCAIQECCFDKTGVDVFYGTHPSFDVLAKNDGLLLQEFKDWFKGYDLSKPMAIIQFTNFRY